MKNKHRAKIGLGFTRKKLRKNPPNDRLIFKVMAHNYAYDVQSEGNRAAYAEWLFQHTRNKKKLVAKFSSYLKQMPLDLYNGHRSHVFQVAARLVDLGFLRKQMVINCALRAYEEDESGAPNVLLDLGRPGVIAFLDLVSTGHPKEEFGRYFPWETRNKELFSLVKGFKIKNADLTANAARFLKDLKKWTPGERTFKRQYESFEEYLEYIKENAFRGRASAFFKGFTDKQMREIESRLLRATSENEINGLLEPIVVNGYRGKTSSLLPLIRHSNRQIRRRACQILGNVPSKKIRKEALLRIKAKEDLRNSIVLLSSTLRKSDDMLILKAIKKYKDFHQLHEFGYALMGAAKIAGPEKLKKSFRFVYLNSRCGICRATILRQYLPLKQLPKAERKAIKYDANEDVRGIAGGE